jgi:hypothetical protein
LNRLKARGVRESTWDGVIEMSSVVIPDLMWWTHMLKENTPMTLVIPQVQAEIWTDASPSGWGAQFRWLTQQEIQQEFLAHGYWRNNWSSNKRELVAVQMAIKYFGKNPSLKHVKSWMVHSDNMTTVYNLNRISSARSLVEPMQRLFLFLQGRQMFVRAVHVRGVDNYKADSLSRLNRAGDYSLNQTVLDKALEVLGVTIDIDLFASYRNRKHHSYCTVSHRDRRCVARDAFSLMWGRWHMPLVHPPFHYY